MCSEGHLMRSSIFFFFCQKWQHGKWSIYIWKRVTCRPTCKCHQQMGIYAEEPLAGGKQTTHLLNHSISVLLLHTQWIRNKEYNTNYSHKHQSSKQSSSLSTVWCQKWEGNEHHHNHLMHCYTPSRIQLLLKCPLCLQISPLIPKPSNHCMGSNLQTQRVF